MSRRMLSSLAIAAIFAMAAAGLLQSAGAFAAEKKGKGTNAGGMLGWATFPPYSKQTRTRLRSTAGNPKTKGNSSTYLRMSQPPAGTSSTAAKKKKEPVFDYEDDDLPAGDKQRRNPKLKAR